VSFVAPELLVGVPVNCCCVVVGVCVVIGVTVGVVGLDKSTFTGVYAVCVGFITIC
jgi:hypothetical protein